jgi:hypothetical protein
MARAYTVAERASGGILAALDAAIEDARRAFEHNGGGSGLGSASSICESGRGALMPLLRRAEDKASAMRSEARARAKAIYVDSLEEGLVRSAVAESSSAQMSQMLPEWESSGSESRIMAPSTENGATCVVCLAAPKDSLLLPCKHLAMCAACTKVLVSSRQPQCPVCRSKIVDCVYNVFL